MLTPSQAHPVATLTQLRAGKALPFSREKLSAINKSLIEQDFVTKYGLSSDEQADLKNHGGTFKAVHQISTRTYELLSKQLGRPCTVGCLGENLSTTAVAGAAELTEDTVCLGDVFAFGTSKQLKLKVCQPRNPCFKIDDQLAAPGTSLWLDAQGLTGWYFEVVEEGAMAQGDPVFLIERPHPEFSLALIWQLAHKQADPKLTEQLLELPTLAPPWRKRLGATLKRR